MERPSYLETGLLSPFQGFHYFYLALQLGRFGDQTLVDDKLSKNGKLYKAEIWYDAIYNWHQFGFLLSEV